jgi:hypothetical protein
LNLKPHLKQEIGDGRHGERDQQRCPYPIGTLDAEEKKQKDERAQKKPAGAKQECIGDKQRQDKKNLLHIETGP